MAIPKDYQCDGQLNLWDYAASITPEPKPYEYDFERYIGQKVKISIQGETKFGKITSFDHYYTEVETDDEEKYACSNLNVYPINENVCQFSGHECNMEESHRIAYMDLDILNCPEVCCRNCDIRLCGARCNGSKEPDPLPSLEEVVGIVSEKFGLQFEKATWEWKDENYFMYVAKYKGARFEVDENTYTGGRLNGERFIGVNWNFGTSGSGRGADTINDVLSFFKRRMKETDNLKEKKKKKGTDDGD